MIDTCGMYLSNNVYQSIFLHNLTNILGKLYLFHYLIFYTLFWYSFIVFCAFNTDLPSVDSLITFSKCIKQASASMTHGENHYCHHIIGTAKKDKLGQKQTQHKIYIKNLPYLAQLAGSQRDPSNEQETLPKWNRMRIQGEMVEVYPFEEQKMLHL